MIVKFNPHNIILLSTIQSDVSKVNHTTPCGDHDNLVTGTPQAKSLNNAGGFKEMKVSVTKEDGSRAKQKSIDDDSISDDSQPPVIHTTDDLAAVLIEHNKLKGRLLQYTTDKVSSSTIMYVTHCYIILYKYRGMYIQEPCAS